MSNCPSIPFKYRGEDYRVRYDSDGFAMEFIIEKRRKGFFSLFFPWSLYRNKWECYTTMDYEDYKRKHPEYNLPDDTQPEYLESIMKFFFFDFVAKTEAYRAQEMNKHIQCEYILNKIYEPEEVGING